MALPAGVSVFSLSFGPYSTITGAASSFAGMQGVLTVSPPMVDTATGAVILEQVSFVVGNDGTATVGPLVHNDDPAINQGTQYTVTWQALSWKATPGNKTFVVPIASGSTVDYDLLSSTTASPAGPYALPLVTSVNGHAGAVTLAASDVGADTAGAATAAQTAAQTYADGKVAAEVTRADGKYVATAGLDAATAPLVTGNGTTAASLKAAYGPRVGQLTGVDRGDALPVTVPSIASMYPGGSQGAATEARGLAVRGRYAYVSANNHFYVVDIAVPSAPVKIADLSDLSVTGTQELVLRGRYAYVLCVPGAGASGISVIDVSNPSLPVSVGSVNDATNIRPVLGGIEVKGRYAYVASYTASGNGTLAIYNISGLIPVFVGKLDNAALAGAVDVKVRGKYAFVGTGGPTVIVDVSNPFTPTQVTTLGSMGQNQALSGKYLYSAISNKVVVANVANPASPSVVGTYTDATSTYLNSAFRLHVAGRYLYVASRLGNGIAVLDVSNPANPALVGAYTAGVTPSSLDHPVSLRAVGRYLYVSCGSYAQFGILDIGGVEQTAAKIDTLAVATIDVSEDLHAERISVGDALVVGGGLKSDGPLTLQGGAVLRSGSGAPAVDGIAGTDWYLRTDTPSTANQRLYVCTTTGAAGSAVWTGIL